MSEGFWVFAYGSLMWQPGFPVAEARRARLRDYRRAFALYSIHYRGTPEAPGLVLGLDWAPGAECIGMALRVEAGSEAEAAAVRRYLAERELVSRAYFEVTHRVELLEPEGWGEVEALCYVVDRTHPQYAGGLPPEEQAAIIARAEGPSGTNRDYLFSTVTHLEALGVEDPALFALAEMVRRRLAG